MSADNQMVVRKIKKNWCAYMEMGDEPYSDGEAISSLFFKKFKDKLKAVAYASKICREEIIEYGIDVRSEL